MTLTEEEALYEKLFEMQGSLHAARLLHDELGLSVDELARGSGAASEEVARWLEQPGDRESRATSGLNDLSYVVLALLRDGGMRIRLLRFWLGARNADISDIYRDPLSAVAAGQFEQVIAVAREFGRGRRSM